MTYYHKRKLQARQQAQDLIELYQRQGATEQEKKELHGFLIDLANKTGNTSYFKQKGYIET